MFLAIYITFGMLVLLTFWFVAYDSESTLAFNASNLYPKGQLGLQS
jgi:hypothetical protein